MRASKPVYSNLKQLGISHTTPTHRGTTAGYHQSRVIHAIPVKVTGTRNVFPIHNATATTKLVTSACNDDNLIYVKCTDDLSRTGRSVNAIFALVNVRSVRNKVVMLPVDTTMAVMCHVLVVCCKLFRGSGCRCGYCRFARSVDTCRRPVMLLLSHSELHADELAWWHSSLSESYHIS